MFIKAQGSSIGIFWNETFSLPSADSWECMRLADRERGIILRFDAVTIGCVVLAQTESSFVSLVFSCDSCIILLKASISNIKCPRLRDFRTYAEAMVSTPGCFPCSGRNTRFSFNKLVVV